MPNQKRPNFVFILTDMQRRDNLGCYGNSIVKTPRIDQLAREGVTFENAFCTNVVCSPSRASIITGRFPRTHGLVTNGMYLDEDREITLPEVLASNGYKTAATGKLHLAPSNDASTEFGENQYGYESPECPAFWKAKKPFPLPYHGFQDASVCMGHSYDWLDYYNWLVDIDPKLPSLMDAENAVEPLTGAPSSWKSAIPEEYHSATWTANEAIKRLQKFAKQDDPFFLFVGIPDPHFPYAPPKPFCDMFDHASVPLPNRSADEIKGGSSEYLRRLTQLAKDLPYHPLDMPEAHNREITAHTYGMMALVDKQVGRIVDEVEKLGLADDTIIVFTTDHGEHLGDHWLIYKYVPYDELFHLPMIWRWPKNFKPGSRPRGIVSHVDIMPTMLELAGLRSPKGVQGVSYTEALTTGEHAGRPYAYLEDDDIEFDRSSYVMRTVRTHAYRMTRLFHVDDGQLFDLHNDPNELHNLYRNPEYREVKADLTDLMLQAEVGNSENKFERIAGC